MSTSLRPLQPSSEMRRRRGCVSVKPHSVAQPSRTTSSSHCALDTKRHNQGAATPTHLSLTLITTHDSMCSASKQIRCRQTEAVHSRAGSGSSIARPCVSPDTDSSCGCPCAPRCRSRSRREMWVSSLTSQASATPRLRRRRCGSDSGSAARSGWSRWRRSWTPCRP